MGWAALAAPSNLGAGGSRVWRLIVHGAGFVDLAQVVFFIVTLVRPWSIAHDNPATAAALPWAGVPLMFALNAHGIRTAWRAMANSERAGFESARGVRGALPGA